jgi:hypothetical protein
MFTASIHPKHNTVFVTFIFILYNSEYNAENAVQTPAEINHFTM